MSLWSRITRKKEEITRGKWGVREKETSKQILDNEKKE